MKSTSLYDIWVTFISSIVGDNAPSIVYAFSFILFIVFFVGCFLGIIKLIFSVFKGK
ncbi:MAG: hypothetical protein ACRC8P_01520 [Spiroplasma sp.]